MTDHLAKKLLFIFRSSLDDSHVGTGLDASLLAAMFEQEVSLLLMGEAVNLLANGEQPNNPLHTRFAQMQAYGVKHIYIDAAALHRFPVELLLHKELLIPVDQNKMKQLIHTNRIVSF